MIIENRQFGKRIREERQRLGLSQAEIALSGGVSLSTQGAYEAGTRVPDLEYLARLSGVGVDAVFVLTGSDDGQTTSAAINWELHDQIIEAIEEWARAHGVVVPFRKEMDLLRFLYPQFLAKGQVDKETMKVALRLVS